MALPSVFGTVCKKNGWRLDGNRVEITLGSDRRQTVLLDSFDDEGEEMLRAYSRVGSADVLSQTRLEAALKLNFSLPHGALAIHEDDLVVTDTFVLAEADPAEIEASLRSVAKTADRYERLIYGIDKN